MQVGSCLTPVSRFWTLVGMTDLFLYKAQKNCQAVKIDPNDKTQVLLMSSNKKHHLDEH